MDPFSAATAQRGTTWTTVEEDGGACCAGKTSIEIDRYLQDPHIKNFYTMKVVTLWARNFEFGCTLLDGGPTVSLKHRRSSPQARPNKDGY